MTPTVSVVLPTLDRPASLRRAIESLLAQQTGDDFSFDVVVIDNGAEIEGETRRTVEAIAAGAPVPVRCVHEARAGVAFARNRGVMVTAAEWIAFFDDDQIADPSWLASLVAAGRAWNAACVGGTIRLRLPSGAEPGSAAFRRLLGEQPFEGATAICIGPDIPSTGNLLVNRRAFVAVGVFDQTMTVGGEDSEWVRRALRAGQRVVVTPAAIAHHVVPPHRMEAGHVLWVAERTGTQLAYTDWKHRGTGWLMMVCAGRLGQAAARVVPALVMARLLCRSRQGLDARLRLRKALGYASHAWTLVTRRRGERAFHTGLDMRAERARLAGHRPMRPESS